MATKLDTQKRYKTSKTGVFYRFCTSNGKKDKAYYILYKDENNLPVESKVGKESEGIGVNFANEKRTESIQNIKHNEPVPIKRKRRTIVTLDSVFKSYIAHAKTEKKSWGKDEELYTNHLKDFHQRELVSLTKSDFNELKIARLKTHAPRTVEYILAVARQIINYAINEEMIKSYVNPISNGKVKVKKVDNANTGFFTREQADLLLNKLQEHKGSTSYIYELTVLLLHTGARFSEVASLTWDEVDFKQGTIFFKATKDGNARHISMTKLVKDVLNSLPRNTSELIISTQRGTQVLQMNKKWQQIVDSVIPNNIVTVKKTNDGEMIELSDKERELLKKQNKTRLTVHSLRHTHASWMVMSGKFNILEVKEELGHKSTLMTERYAHLLPKDRHRKTNELFDN